MIFGLKTHSKNNQIMKQIISILAVTLFLNSSGFGQSLNKEILKNGQFNLIGKIDKKGLEGENYSRWFRKNYERYELDSELIDQIKLNLKNYDITLFLGTWCGDSKQEVPRLYKVLEASNFPIEQLTVIALGIAPEMYKQSPQHEEAGLNIHRVPTVIFYKNGKEMNRIVEHPIDSFEKDIQKIIDENNYKSNYQIVAKIDAILNKDGVAGLVKQKSQLTKTFKGHVSSMYELNTYGRVLYSTNKTEEAISVFELNTKLFPENPRTFMSLANTLGIKGYKEKAIKTLENGLKIHPENTSLKENLEMIKSN